MTLSPSFRYNQSEVLVDLVRGRIRDDGAQSLLDIGAGSSAVAVSLSRSVGHYLAIEEHPTRAKALKDAGIAVIAATFPVALEGVFDLVLSSHSVPEGDMSLYEPFLKAAWRSVALPGRLVIVTFKGIVDGPIQRVSTKVTGRVYTQDPRYAYMVDLLTHLGRCTISSVDSRVRSDVLSDIVEFFAPLFWDDEAGRSRFERAATHEISQSFSTDCGYLVRTPHVVIDVVKDRI
jgi:hypothetical protein